MFAKAREKARQSSCQSNLKQIGLAMLQYAQDYDERLVSECSNPPATNGYFCWRMRVDPYIKNRQTHICPSSTQSTPTGMLINNTSYAQACHVVSNRAMAELTQPAVQAMLGEGGNQIHLKPFNASGSGPCGNACCTVNGTTSLWNGYYFRHNEGANITYVDGHVKWQKQEFVKGEIIASRLFWFQG